MFSVGFTMIVSSFTASASRNAFSSSPAMMAVAALPRSSSERSDHPRWFGLERTWEAERTTDWTSWVTRVSLDSRLAVRWKGGKRKIIRSKVVNGDCNTCKL